MKLATGSPSRRNTLTSGGMSSQTMILRPPSRKRPPRRRPRVNSGGPSPRSSPIGVRDRKSAVSSSSTGAEAGADPHEVAQASASSRGGIGFRRLISPGSLDPRAMVAVPAYAGGWERLQHAIDRRAPANGAKNSSHVTSAASIDEAPRPTDGGAGSSHHITVRAARKAVTRAFIRSRTKTCDSSAAIWKGLRSEVSLSVPPRVHSICHSAGANVRDRTTESAETGPSRPCRSHAPVPQPPSAAATAAPSRYHHRARNTGRDMMTGGPFCGRECVTDEWLPDRARPRPDRRSAVPSRDPKRRRSGYLLSETRSGPVPNTNPPEREERRCGIPERKQQTSLWDAVAPAIGAAAPVSCTWNPRRNDRPGAVARVHPGFAQARIQWALRSRWRLLEPQRRGLSDGGSGTAQHTPRRVHPARRPRGGCGRQQAPACCAEAA
jgi:hypothetical protein